jgi:hypothetical protein
MRRPPLQPVLRARHLVAYGSTNKDRPVKTARRAGPPLAEATEFMYFYPIGFIWHEIVDVLLKRNHGC